MVVQHGLVLLFRVINMFAVAKSHQLGAAQPNPGLCTVLPSSNIQDVASNGTDWVAIAESPNTATNLKTSDGINWVTGGLTVNSGAKIAFGGSLYVVILGNSNYWTSPDGVTWTSRTNATLGSVLTLSPRISICYGAGKYIASGASGSASSSDGINWSSTAGGAGGIMEFDGSNFSTVTQYSTNGTTWTNIGGTPAVGTFLDSNRPIASNGSVWVLMSDYDLGTNLSHWYTRTNGSPWVATTIPVRYQGRTYQNVCANGVELFAFNDFYYPNFMGIRSTNGTTWTDFSVWPGFIGGSVSIATILGTPQGYNWSPGPTKLVITGENTLRGAVVG